jgi:hypothetical protein
VQRLHGCMARQHGLALYATSLRFIEWEVHWHQARIRLSVAFSERAEDDAFDLCRCDQPFTHCTHSAARAQV